jgi:hypothetical protein
MPADAGAVLVVIRLLRLSQGLQVFDQRPGFVFGELALECGHRR